MNTIDHLLSHLELFVCPSCGAKLHYDIELKCQKCGSNYKIENGIPLLYVDEKQDSTITNKVKKFYEKNPFPNYNDTDNTGSLAMKAGKSVFGRVLQEQIAFQSKVLEVGCGTGQMSNYLASVNRQVFGVDLSYSSLSLGQEFKKNNNLGNVGFYQMNIFKPIFKKESFDYIICNGVLHHTKDPYGAFQSILPLVKKDGYLILGFYNTYGRLITDFRRYLINNFGEKFKKLDPNLRGSDMGEEKKNAWYMDQYHNPNESKHTISEIIQWFNDNNVEFIQCIPRIKITENLSTDKDFFKKVENYSNIDIFLNQTKQFLKGSREGGLFVMIGRKK